MTASLRMQVGIKQNVLGRVQDTSPLEFSKVEVNKSDVEAKAAKKRSAERNRALDHILVIRANFF